MLFLAVVISLNAFLYQARKMGYDKDILTDLVLIILFSGIIGARLLYILLNLDFYINNPKEIFMLQHGGLAILGGIVAGILSMFLFCRRKKLPFAQVADLISPYVALAHSIGRIGCFLNGCCYGLPATAPMAGLPCKFGIYFPVHRLTLIPTQLIDSFLLFILFIVLKVKQKRPHKPGAVFVSYILYYSVLRFFVEFIRADSLKLFLGLTIFQYFCIVLFIISLLLWKRKSSK
jgi:phosphatidylglycerol:prolipoprotein diacylglycerol transferase